MTDRELMQQALEALEYAMPFDGANRTVATAITAMRERLKQPAQEPVACIGTNGELMWLKKPTAVYSKPQPLYTAPQPAQQQCAHGIDQKECDWCGPARQEPPKFPTMLRKMWSGGEVQQWINENWNANHGIGEKK